MNGLQGKVAFITGAARGQGRSHAIELAREGVAVIAVDINNQVKSVDYPTASAEDLAETVAHVEALGGQIHAAEADVRDADRLAAVVEEGLDRFGRLDIVSANAGICSISSAVDMSEGTWQDMIDINLTGVWHTAKAAIPHIVSGGRGGSIVITSSAAGLKGYQSVSHYASAKHGLVGLMRSLALELASDSIRVNSLHPTQVDTPMIMNKSIFELFRPDLERPTRDDFAAASMSTNALPVPWVEPIDVSRALLFLASDDARYITGVALPIDAGSTVL